MKKFLGSIFFILVALVIFVVVAKDLILKAAIDQGVTRLTGFNTKVDSLHYSFPSTIEIKGLKIQNPAEFEAKIFADIPEIYISLVFDELIQGKGLHLPEVRLNIQEVNIEKNPQGVSNVELLSSVGGKAKKQPQAEQKPETSQKQMPFWLEKLHLTIRNVGYQDRSGLAKNLPVGNKIAMDLNVKDQVFSDIRDPKVLVNLILMKILNGATIGRLLDIDPQQLLGGTLGGVQNTLNAGVGTLANEAGKATQAVVNNEIAKTVADNAVTQKTTELLKTSGSEAGQVLGSATSTAKNKLTGLLGKAKSLTGESAPAESGTAAQ